jgi:hypothetical protein
MLVDLHCWPFVWRDGLSVVARFSGCLPFTGGGGARGPMFRRSILSITIISYGTPTAAFARKSNSNDVRVWRLSVARFDRLYKFGTEVSI